MTVTLPPLFPVIPPTTPRGGDQTTLDREVKGEDGAGAVHGGGEVHVRGGGGVGMDGDGGAREEGGRASDGDCVQEVEGGGGQRAATAGEESTGWG
jgi:hypothetical protein